jgi:excisionase family DNA binding protein
MADGQNDKHPNTVFEPLLDSEEAARLLGVHPKTLVRMARQGKLPASRIGSLWRFRASELDCWLRGQYYTVEVSSRAA